jgi:hypothetical protein
MKTRISAVLGAVALALVLPATTVGASESDAGSSAESTEPMYCVLNLANGETACDTSESVARQSVAEGRTTYLLAQLYDWVNLNPDGGVLNIVDSSPCTDSYADDEKVERDLREARDSSGTIEHWNNRASSVDTWNNCDIKLYDNLNVEGSFAGPSSTWIDEADHLSEVGDGWNDRASSLKIS